MLTATLQLLPDLFERSIQRDSRHASLICGRDGSVQQTFVSDVYITRDCLEKVHRVNFTSPLRKPVENPIQALPGLRAKRQPAWSIL
mmetsp:Transcript_35693/g.82434  ORF Transcript_35693/g.82434 Transcript_35693/m.82434 type:complete len:87 (-) Transcript_35693:301-561(-)